MNNLKFIPTPQWAPDLAETSTAVQDLNGLYPISLDENRGVVYTSIPLPTPLSVEPLPGRPLGEVGFTNTVGEHINIVGTKSDIYKLLDDGSWGSVKPESITLSDESEGDEYVNIQDWEFTRFGDNVLGVSGIYYPVVLKSGADKFIELPGNPPRAQRIAVVSDFVFLGGIEGHPTRIQWSGYNNSEIWEGDGENQSDFQDLLGGGGDVVRIVGGDIGYVFQQNSIRRVEFQGGDVIFSIENILPEIGTDAPGSICRQGKSIFFYGHNGFYALHAASAELDFIGANTVNDFFRRHTDKSSLATVRSAVDFKRSLVWWCYSSRGNRGVLDRALIYNFTNGLWAKQQNQNYVHVGTLNPRGAFMDELDDTEFFPDPTGMDTPNAPPLDDPVFQGGVDFAVFTSNVADGTYEANTLSGPPQSGQLCTQPLFSDTGRKIFTSRVRPSALRVSQVDPIVVTTFYKDQTFDGYTEGDTYEVDVDTQEVNPDVESLYQYYRLTFPKGIKHLFGVFIDSKPGGAR